MHRPTRRSSGPLLTSRPLSFHVGRGGPREAVLGFAGGMRISRGRDSRLRRTVTGRRFRRRAWRWWRVSVSAGVWVFGGVPIGGRGGFRLERFPACRVLGRLPVLVLRPALVPCQGGFGQVPLGAESFQRRGFGRRGGRFLVFCGGGGPPPIPRPGGLRRVLREFRQLRVEVAYAQQAAAADPRYARAAER